MVRAADLMPASSPSERSDSATRHPRPSAHRVLSREQGIEYVTAARRLQEEGLIKHIGLSEVSALDLRAAHAVAPVCAIRARTSFPYCPVPPPDDDAAWSQSKSGAC